MVDIIGIMTVSITLFAVIDMLGNIPLILNLRKEYGEIDSLRGSVISAIVMIFTLFFGKTIFQILGIDTHHFGLAGSFLIIFFGFKMVMDIKIRSGFNPNVKSATIFPMVFPLIAGPGTLSTIISMRSEYNDLTIVLGILINSIVIYLVLKLAGHLKDKIGIVGIELMERIFGVILIAIGVKMFIYNLILSINQVIENL